MDVSPAVPGRDGADRCHCRVVHMTERMLICKLACGFHGANGVAGTSGCGLAARLRTGSGTPRANMTYPYGIIGITCLGLIHDYLRLRPTAQAAGYKFTPRGHQDHRITTTTSANTLLPAPPTTHS